jgi:KaiC/GvpD/RAD55 family RecA-like ATPase
MEKVITDCRMSVLLVTGVPGIGKSIFLIYFLVSLMLEKEGNVGHKSFFLEFNRGVYQKITSCGVEKETQ